MRIMGRRKERRGRMEWRKQKGTKEENGRKIGERKGDKKKDS